MFDHKHYVPILKTKSGERWALSFLSAGTKSHLTPVLELHEHDTNDIDDHADDICDNLATQWGTDRPLFLDTLLLHDDSGDAATITTVFDAARANGLLAIPVIRPSYAAPALTAVAHIAATDGRGCMIRSPRAALANPSVLAALPAAVGLSPAKVHFLLDYFKGSMALATDVPLVPTVAAWQTFTAASGVFPASVFKLAPGTWHAHPRSCWASWLPPVTGGGLARRPAFSDYATRDPGKPAAFGDPIVNVRYLTDGEWRVRVAGKHKEGYGYQMRDVCASLISQPFYSGPTFSMGDERFHAVAAAGSQCGGPTQWLQWSVNHHLVFAANQIQTHAGL